MNKNGQLVIFLWIIVIISVILLISGGIAGYFLYANYQTNSLSYKIPKKIQIDFQGNTLNQLNQYYSQTGEKEFAVCLDGTLDEKNKQLTVTKVSELTIGDDSSVEWLDCSGHFAHLHKHPPQEPNSYPSIEDVYSSCYSFKNHGIEASLIMYGTNKFAVYTEDKWIVGYRYETG